MQTEAQYSAGLSVIPRLFRSTQWFTSMCHHWHQVVAGLTGLMCGHQQKGTLLAMPYRISTLQMPCHINSKYIQGD